jgi:hypothetical protein
MTVLERRQEPGDRISGNVAKNPEPSSVATKGTDIVVRFSLQYESIYGCL